VQSAIDGQGFVGNKAWYDCVMQTQELLDRCEYTIKYQMNEIDRLRAELDRRDDELNRLLEWINGDADALVCLQRTYMDPKISTTDRIKAAGAAIAYERPKLTVQLRVGPAVLGERLDQTRPMKTIEPELIEHDPAA
jgi:hypothetical protein